MSKKEKVALHRSDDFEEMDELLSDALANLDESNQRVLSILENEDVETGETAPEDPAPESPENNAEATADSGEREQAAASDTES